MRRVAPWVLAVLLIVATTSAYGHDMASMKTTPPQTVSLTGEIIEPQCYFSHGSQGIDHASCAVICAKGGQSLAFLETKTRKVYPLIAQGHGENPNKLVIAHIGMPVAVKGRVFSRDGYAVLFVESISEVKGGRR